MEVAVGNSSGTDIIPQIIPCCYGKEVGVEPEIIRTGLAAISIKRNPKKDKSGNQDRRFENRNSFFNLLRPEMTKINWVSTSPRKIEQFFHDHATNHGPFCAYLHADKEPVDDDFRCLLQPNEYEYHEEEFGGVSNSMGNSVLLRSCSMQLSDEDLHPSNICHRSRAEFCVTIGTNTESPFRPVSQAKAAAAASPAERRGSPVERRGSLPPLTKVPRTQKAGSRTSPLGSLQHLSTIGQSMEIAAVMESDAQEEDDDADEDVGNFQVILSSQEVIQQDPSQVDELKIRSLTKQRGTSRAPTGKNFSNSKFLLHFTRADPGFQ